MFECEEMHFVQTGGIAVCESSCFGEPILVYSKGAVINLYQIIMQQKLDFKFLAVSKDSFKMDSQEKMILIKYNRNNSEIFTGQSGITSKFAQDEIELLSLSGTLLLQLCDTYPKTAAVLQ